ncbi:hypothetical protein ACLBXM_16190 [Xanthobacteraceae bacterium A53D]
MTTGNTGIGRNSESISLESMPKTALQAIYHAVTGKTENFTKYINGNVIVRSADIDNLYQMICDQMGHYSMPVSPTVTVIVKCANGKSITYSSWERYERIRVSLNEVTSEISLKIEFLVDLPNTPQPQRLILNVNVDSSLPILQKRNDPIEGEMDGFSLYLFTRSEWRTVELSIDFVDYMVAKIFSSVVEEWFATLKVTPRPYLNNFLMKNQMAIRSTLAQTSRVGMAAFLLTYAFSGSKESFEIDKILIVISISMMIWSMLSML